MARTADLSCPAGPPSIVTVAIAALEGDMGRIVLPEPHPRLRYDLWVQSPAGKDPDMPNLEMPGTERLARADVAIRPLPGLGLSRSRNAALAATRTPFLIFSDADIVLSAEGVLALAEAMEAAPHLAFAAGWRADRLAAARPARRAAHRLGLRTAGRVCAPELMIRPEAFRAAGVAFDTDFGLGAVHGVGEEYVLLADARRSGLRGMSWPIVTGSHPGASTGTQALTPALWRARQAMLARVFGRFAPLVRPVYAWRMRHHMRPGTVPRLRDIAAFAAGAGQTLSKAAPDD